MSEIVQQHWFFPRVMLDYDRYFKKSGAKATEVLAAPTILATTDEEAGACGSTMPCAMPV
jgi:hypothetical protein